MNLGLIMIGVEAKRVKENKKKPMEYFLCFGLHRLQNCSKRSKLSTINKEKKAKPKEDFDVIHIDEYDFMLA